MKQHDLHLALSEEFPDERFVTEIDFRNKKFLVTCNGKRQWVSEISYRKFSEMSDKELFTAVKESYNDAA